MKDASDPILTFLAAAESSFTFLGTWGFQRLDAVTENGDPRDAATTVTFKRERRVVAVRLSHIGLGLSLLLGDAAPGLALKNVIDFDEYLLAFHRSDLTPPFPEMGKDVVFSGLANRDPKKYFRVIRPRLEQAVGVLAERFTRYGHEVVDMDLGALRARIGRPRP